MCEYKGPGDSERMSKAARTREILRTNSSSVLGIFCARSDGEMEVPEMGRDERRFISIAMRRATLRWGRMLRSRNCRGIGAVALDSLVELSCIFEELLLSQPELKQLHNREERFGLLWIEKREVRGVVRKGEGLELLTLLKRKCMKFVKRTAKEIIIEKKSQYWGLKYSQTPHHGLPGEGSMELSKSCSLTSLHGLLTAFGDNIARKMPNPSPGNYYYSHLRSSHPTMERIQSPVVHLRSINADGCGGC